MSNIDLLLVNMFHKLHHSLHKLLFLLHPCMSLVNTQNMLLILLLMQKFQYHIVRMSFVLVDLDIFLLRMVYMCLIHLLGNMNLLNMDCILLFLCFLHMNLLHMVYSRVIHRNSIPLHILHMYYLPSTHILHNTSNMFHLCCYTLHNFHHMEDIPFSFHLNKIQFHIPCMLIIH